MANMVLPGKGEEVPLAKINEICEHYGLEDLWAKIDQGPTASPLQERWLFHVVRQLAGDQSLSRLFSP